MWKNSLEKKILFAQSRVKSIGERERENEILRQSLIIQEFSREFTHKSKEKKNFYFSHVNLLNSLLTLKQKFYVMRQRDFTRAEQKFILPDQGNWRRRHSVSDDDMDFGSDEERERESGRMIWWKFWNISAHRSGYNEMRFFTLTHGVHPTQSSINCSRND